MRLKIGNYHTENRTVKDILLGLTDVPISWKGYYVAVQKENHIAIYWHKRFPKCSKTKEKIVGITKNGSNEFYPNYKFATSSQRIKTLLKIVDNIA